MALAYVTGYIILYGVQFTVEIKKKPKKNLDFHRRMFFFFFLSHNMPLLYYFCSDESTRLFRKGSMRVIMKKSVDLFLRYRASKRLL